MGLVRSMSGHRSKGYHAQAGIYSRAVLTSTLFYRNRPQLDVLFGKLIPSLRDRKKTSRLRLASMACSTGCEPYTLAMEACRHGLGDQLELYGYDIDPGCVETARRASYTIDQFQDSLAGGVRPPADVIETYFVKTSREGRDIYTVKEPIRASVRFGVLDILNPDMNALPPGGFDVVLLQNVLLHFSNECADRAMDHVLRMMAAPAVLVIGGANLDWLEGACPRLGLRPIADADEAIHNGWVGRRKLYDIGDRSYLGLEPYGFKDRAPRWRYCSLFIYDPRGSAPAAGAPVV